MNNVVYNQKKSGKTTIFVMGFIIVVLLAILGWVLFNDKIDNLDTINYQIRSSMDLSTGIEWEELYINDKKVDGVKVNSELGEINVDELGDLIIVDQIMSGPSRKLLAIDKKGNIIALDYKGDYSNDDEFISWIDSYRIDNNDLYIVVQRQWGNGYIDWYCKYSDKNAVAEYELKYEYLGNGKFSDKKVIREVTILDKYKNQDCGVSSEASNKIDYEVKYGSEEIELYVNGKKANGIKANIDAGKIKVESFNNLLIVDEYNPGASRRLLIVDKDANAKELDYKVGSFDFIYMIDSYRAVGNNIYLIVKRQWGNGYVDWYCHFDDKNEIAEYELKYEYLGNGNFSDKKVIREISIADKFKNEKCITNSDKIKYEVKEEVDSSTGAKWNYLYVNNKKIDDIRTYEDVGEITVKEIKDLLVVYVYNPNKSNLYAVNASGVSTMLNYKVQPSNSEFTYSIDSYKIENDSIYITVKGQLGNGETDWYCKYTDKNELVEYEIKYDYLNGKFGNKQLVKEVTIAEKYKNEDCMNNSSNVASINYEIKSEEDSNTGIKWNYLYVNNKKVDVIKSIEDIGQINVKEFKDLLIVFVYNPNKTQLYSVNGLGVSTFLDYNVQPNKSEFINNIDSYRIENDSLYMTVVRQVGNGYIDWYCHYNDKTELAEYEIKYDYFNGNFVNKQLVKEVTIADKYKDVTC